MIRRYAIVRGNDITLAKVAPYLPSNYRVEGEADCPAYEGDRLAKVVVVSGIDQAGWTMDGYVIPRLGSGLWGTQEVDLSHPVMMQIPMES